MGTQRSEFQSLAAELFEEFADFASDAVISQSTGFKYSTQSNTVQSQTIKMIAVEYSNSLFQGSMRGDIDGGLIKSGDKMLIGQYQLLAWEPEPDNTTVSHEGKDYQVVRVTSDPAKAVITLHVKVL